MDRQDDPRAYVEYDDDGSWLVRTGRNGWRIVAVCTTEESARAAARLLGGG